MISAIERLFKHEAAGGVALMAAAVLALIVANSSLSGVYSDVLAAKLSITLNDEGLSKPLILWINDGLMAIFFFLIGLELKRELLEGKLKNPRDVMLPGVAAIGGMVVPAVIFAGMPAVSSGSQMTTLGIISGWKITFLVCVASLVTTPARPTSDPVPAVVGTATTGAIPLGSARVHQSPMSSKSQIGRV